MIVYFQILLFIFSSISHRRWVSRLQQKATMQCHRLNPDQLWFSQRFGVSSFAESVWQLRGVPPANLCQWMTEKTQSIAQTRSDPQGFARHAWQKQQQRQLSLSSHQNIDLVVSLDEPPPAYEITASSTPQASSAAESVPMVVEAPPPYCLVDPSKIHHMEHLPHYSHITPVEVIDLHTATNPVGHEQVSQPWWLDW